MVKGIGRRGAPYHRNRLLRAQRRWPGGMPLCRPMGKGLWEVRTDLPSNRTARALICFCHDRLVALHGFIKKTKATPTDELRLYAKDQKQWERRARRSVAQALSTI